MHSRTPLDQLRALWRHAAWSDVVLLEGLRGADPLPEGALAEYAHLVAAEEVWLSRLERRPSRSPVWPTLAVEQAAALGNELREGYQRFLESLDAEDVMEDVRYATTSGAQFVNSIGDILLHVALHGQYHRGRVNLLLRQHGATTVGVDYIGFARGVPMPVPTPQHGGVTTLVLPGLYDSGPEHWQSRWERLDATCRRVVQDDWVTPRCDDWVATLERAVVGVDGLAVLVAHSSATSLVAHWARAATPASLAKVRGALLVAPSDPTAPNYPSGPSGFVPVPMQRLPFPSIVVASSNDEYVSLARAREYAGAWGSEFVNVGPRGHINSASALGDWTEGYALLGRLRSAASRAT